MRGERNRKALERRKSSIPLQCTGSERNRKVISRDARSRRLSLKQAIVSLSLMNELRKV